MRNRYLAMVFSLRDFGPAGRMHPGTEQAPNSRHRRREFCTKALKTGDGDSRATREPWATQRELAEGFGTTESATARLEYGNVSPSLATQGRRALDGEFVVSFMDLSERKAARGIDHVWRLWARTCGVLSSNASMCRSLTLMIIPPRSRHKSAGRSPPREGSYRVRTRTGHTRAR